MEGYVDSGRRREFDCIEKLYGDSAVYCVIPQSVILNGELGEKRAAVFSYFAFSCGRWGRVGYCVNDIVEWTKRTPRRGKGKINSHISDCIAKLGDAGFLHDIGKIGDTSFSHARLDLRRLEEERGGMDGRYAVLYLDEIEKVFEHFKTKRKDAYANVDAAILVFAYLRMMIYRRRNTLFPEECDTDYRKSHSPEVYDALYADIGNDLGLSARVVSRIVDALEDIGLVHVETPSRVRRGKGWITRPVLLCNAYKREGDELIADGKAYYDEEIKNKMRMLERMGRSTLLGERPD